MNRVTAQVEDHLGAPASTRGVDLSIATWEDPQRPGYHLVPPGGWLNDPNGMARWDGTFHLFYQYNPHAPVHSLIHWGHVTSTDLVRWRDEPVALVPSEGPDAEGCWSGVLVDDGGVPTLVYSGHSGEYEVACLATGSPDLRTWTKDPANPVVAGPPEGVDATAFRDHGVWLEDGRWHQVIGSGIRGVGGAPLHYTSADLREWTYTGPLVVGDASSTEPVWTGTMWECVDLFTLDGTDVVVFSAWDDGVTLYPVYLTGRRDGSTFVPDGPARHLDYGLRHFYAPQSVQDDDGRRIMFAWLQEARGDAATAAAGWSGAMSLPREVTLDSSGALSLAPATEVATLRGARLHAGPVDGSTSGRAPCWLEHVAGDQLDLVLDIHLPVGARLELGVRATSDGVEQTVVTLERETAEPVARLRLDRSRSSLDPDVDAVGLGGDVPLDADGRVDLRVLVDHSALEIFAGGRPLTARLYPTRPDAVGTWVRTCAGPAAGPNTAAPSCSLEAWRMESIWNGPRPLWPEP
ncbi:glycoside hydrolase family 32 protein [Pengzhenrongella sp.]|uniref:glycoside hydrolase family 32 protein n=1 Tax=Pengzhenrongella sp. TaxID=2888820 RepID=UPI002F93FBC3